VSAAGQKPLLETDVSTWEKGEANEAYRQTDVEYSICREADRQPFRELGRKIERRADRQTYTLHSTHRY
jgi:hypothetical protein